MSAERIPVLGIIGGIGSGKTAVAEELQRFVKSHRLDADAAGHLALRQPEVQQKLRNTFGDAVLDDEGNVIRPRLAELVFGPTDEHRRARRKLEAIVHPLIRNQLLREIEDLQQQRLCAVIILDAALLLEAGWDRLCDAVAFVDVPRHERLRRTSTRGWTAEEFERREASQLDVADKQCRADVVIDNSHELPAAARILADWIRTRFFDSPACSA